MIHRFFRCVIDILINVFISAFHNLINGAAIFLAEVHSGHEEVDFVFLAAAGDFDERFEFSEVRAGSGQENDFFHSVCGGVESCEFMQADFTGYQLS
jgi:hypothetical protein